MAYSVTVTAAERMMPVVYERLAAGGELLSAVQAGRRRLFDDKWRRAYFDQELELEDWVLPVVFWQRPVRIQPTAATPEQQAELLEAAQQVDEPHPAYGFVGRDLDVQAIERRLLTDAANNELLVRGMAGAGKSTLLEHLGWWWQATGLIGQVLRFSYEDRAWTATQIVQAIAQRLLDPIAHGTMLALSDDAQLEQIAARLRAERHVLVLDNVESIAATPASIPHALPDAEQQRVKRLLTRLRGGKTLVVLGSRGEETWLAPGTFASNVYELEGLDPQAASVLVERILARHHLTVPSDQEGRDALKALLDVLGGYPLPLTVVLPALASAPASRVLADLRSGGDSADPARLIQRAIELSHGRPITHCRTRSCCSLPSRRSCSSPTLDEYAELLATHAAVRELGPINLHSALEQAIDVGLARRDSDIPGLVRVQPMLPYFLRTRMAENRELANATAAAHHDLYQLFAGELHDLLVSREPGPRALGRALVHAEYANLTSALGHAVANGHAIRTLVFTLEEYLDQAQQQHARRELLEDAIAAVTDDATHDRRDELAALHNLAGVAAVQQHRLDDARKHHEAELRLKLELGDRQAAARAYHQLGVVAQAQRRFVEADEHYLQAIGLSEEFGDRHGSARSYHQLGTVAQERRRFEEAEAHHRKALELKLEFNDRYGAARSYHQLGTVAQELRRFDEAEAHYRQGLALFLEFADLHSASRSYHQLGTVAQEQGRLGDAETHYRRALDLKLEFDDRHSAASTYHQLGIVAQDHQRFGEAEANYRKALEIFLEFDDKHSAASSYHQLGSAAHEQGRLRRSRNAPPRRAQALLECDDPHGAARSYYQLGVVTHDQGRIDEAELNHRKALELSLEHDDPEGAGRNHHRLGTLAYEEEQLEEAEAHARKALELFLAIDDANAASRSYYQLASVAEKQGRSRRPKRSTATRSSSPSNSTTLKA